MAPRTANIPRITRSLTIGALFLGLLAAAACSTSGTSGPATITQTVIITSPSTAGESTASDSSTSGAPVTVVAPSAIDAAGDGSTASTEPTPGEPAQTTGAVSTSPDPGMTGESATSTTPTTTATTLDKEGRAVLRKLATRCNTVLTRADITAVFGSSAMTDASLRTTEEGNPDNQMTARTKCYYGTDDLSVARPLVVALAGFATPEAAARQIAVTTDSEKAAGAKTSQTQVGSTTVQLLLRDGGMAMAQSGAMTVSIAVADGIATDAKLTAALPSLMSSVLKHLG